MERAQTLHKRLRLDDPSRDVWVNSRRTRRTPRVNGHQHFPRSLTFVESRQNSEDSLVTSEQFSLENLIPNASDNFHHNTHEGESEITWLPHPHRPLAMSYPMIGKTEDLHHLHQRPIHAHPWHLSRSKTEYIERLPLHFNRDLDETAAASDAGSSGRSSEAELHSPEPSPMGTHPEHPKKRRRMDILQLCEHLKTHGLGEPVMSTSSHASRSEKLPPGVKARCLPRDPSTREKIKGRARLDYELANLRAVAFCEQQHPRTFRTASANLRNRDMRLLEEEEREQVHRELQEKAGQVVDEEDDDASSLVGSPLSREELFCRIEAWADDVDRALHRGHS